MKKRPAYTHEEKAAIAFNYQASVFDDLYSEDPVILYKRDRVRNHLLKYLHSDSHLLELNAGTGEDAIFLAKRGHHVHATDIATCMQDRLREKASANGLADLISNEICSFTELDGLKEKGPYDGIFSNFAGLNCTGDLGKVLASFDSLLKPGGVVTLVILPKFCLWETLLIFKGKFKTATRRFFSSRGRSARIDGSGFTCWYYSPSFIIKQLKDKFDLMAIEGLCVFVPPSYIENFVVKYPRLFNYLKEKESRFKSSWPWRLMGDYYIISLRKKGG